MGDRMKRTISFLLAFLLLSFCWGCAFPVKNAAEITTAYNFFHTLDEAVKENPQKAEKQYLGQTVQATILIDWLPGDGSVVQSTDDTRLVVKLSEDELSRVKKGDVLTVEGTVSEFSEYVPSKWSKSGNRTQVEISPAKIIEDTYQISGEVSDYYIWTAQPPCEWAGSKYIAVYNDTVMFGSKQVSIYAPEEELRQYEIGDTITAKGRLCLTEVGGSGWLPGLGDDEEAKILLDMPDAEICP
ncbi:MAG: hypothetical protein J1E06_07540 [Acutalibacter sp.]|nr:hypothetical protein [Acutalibacter sp.]